MLKKWRQKNIKPMPYISICLLLLNNLEKQGNLLNILNFLFIHCSVLYGIPITIFLVGHSLINVETCIYTILCSKKETSLIPYVLNQKLNFCTFTYIYYLILFSIKSVLYLKKKIFCQVFARTKLFGIKVGFCVSSAIPWGN